MPGHASEWKSEGLLHCRAQGRPPVAIKVASGCGQPCGAIRSSPRGRHNTSQYCPGLSVTKGAPDPLIMTARWNLRRPVSGRWRSPECAEPITGHLLDQHGHKRSQRSAVEVGPTFVNYALDQRQLDAVEPRAKS